MTLDGSRMNAQGTHDELLATNGANVSLWREQERAKGWRILTVTEISP